MSDFSDVKKIVDLFVYYYKNVNNLSHFAFRMTPSKRKTILNFVSEIRRRTESELQDDYLNSFFDFQFNRWYKKDNPYGRGISIQIEWIIGKKALDLWFARDKQKSAFIVRKNLKKDIKFERKVEKEDYEFILTELNKVEENEKSRFFGTLRGFNYCELTTTLFNHKSPFCTKCPRSENCKKLLKKEYPKIFKKRGYK